MNIVLDEAEPGDQARIQSHLEVCESCRVALHELGLTRKLLAKGIPQEEPPRRIAFVGGAEAIPASGFGFLWQRAFAVPLGIAAAMVIMIAALAAGHTRLSSEQGRWQLAFGTVPAATAQPRAVPAAQNASMTPEQVQRIVNAAVQASEQRLATRAAALVTAAASQSDRRSQAAYQMLAEQLTYLKHDQNVVYKENEGTRAQLEMINERLPAEKGATQ